MACLAGCFTHSAMCRVLCLILVCLVWCGVVWCGVVGCAWCTARLLAQARGTGVSQRRVGGTGASAAARHTDTVRHTRRWRWRWWWWWWWWWRWRTRVTRLHDHHSDNGAGAYDRRHNRRSGATTPASVTWSRRRKCMGTGLPRELGAWRQWRQWRWRWRRGKQ